MNAATELPQYVFPDMAISTPLIYETSPMQNVGHLCPVGSWYKRKRG
jgi:hypothetical protein